MTVYRLLLVGLLLGLTSCAGPEPEPPSPADNVASLALLEECDELVGLIEQALGSNGEIVGQPQDFLDAKKRLEFLELKEFVDGMRLKQGLNSVEMEELQTLTTGIYSLEMMMRGTPLSSDMPDVGAFWIDRGVKYVRLWCG